MHQPICFEYSSGIKMIYILIHVSLSCPYPRFLKNDVSPCLCLCLVSVFVLLRTLMLLDMLLVAHSPMQNLPGKEFHFLRDFKY